MPSEKEEKLVKCEGNKFHNCTFLTAEAFEQSRQEGCIYKHYKGGEYIKLHEGYIESDGAQVVIYQHCKTKEVWVRPIDEFNEKFTLPNPPIEESDNAE